MELVSVGRLECLELKNSSVQTKYHFHITVLGEKLFQISLHSTFAFKVVRQLLYWQCGKIFQFCAEESSDCAKNMNVSELRGSAPLHRVRCPVVIFI